MDIIRKIIIGTDPKDAMAYYVGMRAGGGEVAAIILDEEHLVRYNMKRYLVYIENADGTMLWKAVDNMPCLVEYDCRFD
jgi:hypothetical protein